MLVNSALLIQKPQQPCKLPSNSKSRVGDQLQHDEHSNDFNIWNSEQFSPPIASTAARATILSMLSSTTAGAVKLNPNTNQINNKDIKTELSKWFSNARDRGTDGRRYTIPKTIMTAPSSD
ncbi:uncharacterized protein LOC136090132 [Hydra vulgaris]|uniref:Uncharacterized protein LOC136090132 n=1 Tax=Hydra vulgaris TaxID=6087 RepID=A0ABM4DD31_HYDVU